MDAVEQKKTVLDSLGPMQGFIEVVMNFGGVLGDVSDTFLPLLFWQ